MRAFEGALLSTNKRLTKRPCFFLQEGGILKIGVFFKKLSRKKKRVWNFYAN